MHFSVNLNAQLFIVVPFPSLSGAFEDWNVGKYFFFHVSILMASDGGGLMNSSCALLYEFNIKLFIVIPFKTPSEALRVGTYIEQYFFHARSNFHDLAHGYGLVEQQAMYNSVYFQDQGAMFRSFSIVSIITFPFGAIIKLKLNSV